MQMDIDQQRSDKSGRLEQLRLRLVGGVLPPPCASSDRLVFGEGSPVAHLAIVGEAPGEQEERQGRPFVGRAGQLLRKTLEQVGLTPADVWITNVVKCRPTAEAGGQRINRTPTRREADYWDPWLREELQILRPAAILCLGNLAASTLIRRDFKMNRDRGKWFNSTAGAPALATFHPAFVLRQGDAQGGAVRQLFEEDLAQARQQ